MLEQFFTDDAVWFGVPALLGTALFVIRIAFMLVAGDADLDFGDTGDGLDVSDDSGDAFSILSIQSLSAFAMGFGWGGLGGLNGAGWSQPVSLAVGFGCGAGLVWLLALLLKGIHDLQSSGTITSDAALGSTGEVYITVPGHSDGSGQVRVVIGDRQRIYPAVTQGEALPTKTRVRVLSVNDDRSLTVAPV